MKGQKLSKFSLKLLKNIAQIKKNHVWRISSKEEWRMLSQQQKDRLDKNLKNKLKPVRIILII